MIVRFRDVASSILPVVLACGAPGAGATSDDSAELTGGQCSVATCNGAGCSSFEPDGEYVNGNGLSDESAPSTGSPFVPLVQRQLRVGDAANDVGSGGQWLRPSIPPQRTTADGRVGVTQAGNFVAMKLELLRNQPVMRSAKNLGDNLEGRPVAMNMTLPNGEAAKLTKADLEPSGSWPRSAPTDTNPIDGSTAIRGASAGPEITICEDSQDQPHACPNVPGSDCYDVRLIQHVAVTTKGGEVQLGLESIPIRIRVTNPKTDQAEVASVVVGAKNTWKYSQLAPFASFDEGLNTRDGHLLVGRILDPENADGSVDYQLSDLNVHRRAFSLAYAYAADACDVSEWLDQSSDGALTSMRPLSAAPYDTRINGNGGDPKYGFAARPFRDAHNDVIPETGILPGSYPWVDKEGRNIVFSTVSPDLFTSDSAQSAARYPLKHTGTEEAFGSVGGAPRGFAVVGNWTNGKIVTLDDMINNDDSGIRPDDEYELGLYTSRGNPVAVRVNGGAKLDTGGLRLGSAVANNHHIDSTENMTAMHVKSAAVTPRDVVWTINRGLNSEEVAFDDYIDPHVVLFGEMNASWSFVGRPGFGSLQDGFTQASDNKSFLQDPTAIRLQNAATSPMYSIASTGQIDGPGRIEPVAAGGIQGRGLWLESGSDAHWDFPSDTGATVGSAGFFASVFLDARENLSGVKHVFSLQPTSRAATEVTLKDGSYLSVSQGSESLTFDISCTAQSFNKVWHHIGVLFETDGAVTPFVDGNPVGTQKLATPVRLVAGKFIVGGTALSGAAGIRGWYDEARVVVNGVGNQLTRAASVELLCNYARGTMVAAQSPSPFFAAAGSTPSIAARIESVGAPSGPSGSKMICATDYAGYTDDNHGYSLGVNYLPPHTLSMRASILLEGTQPLAYNQPRPDSTGRSFCQSCHVSQTADAARTSTLSLEALTAIGKNADLDPRTQPSQPSLMPGNVAVRAWGWLPAGWVDTADGKSLPAMQTYGDSVLLLDYVLRGR
jgi:hypothetical protein